jgi:rubrerythrin
MAFAERLPLIKKLEGLRGSKVICYLNSLRPGMPGQMADDAIPELLDQLLAIPETPVEKLDLFLCSNGGDSVLPWRLVPVFRHFAKSFAVLVPYHAYSSATILALGANEIVMHPFGVLGPIDPTVTNEFNPQIQPGRLSGISVEDVKAYVNFVKQTVGITHEDELAQMLSILAEKVHPLALGNVERFLSQSRMIARKLLKTHMDLVSERDIEDIVENLASKLYFHGHPINRSEAEKELRLKIAIDVPTEVEEGMWQLYTDFETEFRNREPFQPFVELANQLQPWAVPQQGQPPQIQVVHQTTEVPLAIEESGTSSSVQKVKNRFTLISAFGQQDQQRQELLAVEWSRTPAPAPAL